MLLSANDRDWLHARKFPNPSKLLIQILEPNRSSTNYRKRIVSRLVSYVFTSPQKLSNPSANHPKRIHDRTIVSRLVSHVFTPQKIVESLENLRPWLFSQPPQKSSSHRTIISSLVFSHVSTPSKRSSTWKTFRPPSNFFHRKVRPFFAQTIREGLSSKSDRSGAWRRKEKEKK